MTPTILVPLTKIDQSSPEAVAVTGGYVVRNVDPSILKAAAIRVIDKWRLLAGQVEWSAKLSGYCIRVPTQGDISHRLTFTTSKSSNRLDPAFLVNDESSAHVLSRPPLKYFRHASVPSSIHSYAASKAPIVSIHVTHLKNCACIGLTFPHGVFDAVGMGHCLHGLDHELHGRPWDAPIVSEKNILQEVLDDLESSPRMYDDIHQETATFSSLRRALVPATYTNLMYLLTDIVKENVWHRAETKAVYLGPNIVKKMVREIKDEVQRFGNVPPVSTGDILTAWMLKALHADEDDATTVCLISIFSLRAMFAEKYPTMRDYPHNGFALCPLPPFTKQQLAQKSLAELAIFHRQGLKPASEIAWAQAYNTYLNKALRGHFFCTQGSNQEGWGFSNQDIGRADQIDFGSRMAAFWVWFTPTQPHRYIGINRYKEGYIIEATARSSRWRAVERVVKELDIPQARL
ncbi:hypothetical protein H0H93_008846 [Arthromyces matolae]|nr:hypothetical protein H0H93_008846 [Arthromyces matolae]